MEHFIVFDNEITAVLNSSKEIESELAGEWVYFDSSKGSHATALYKVNENVIEKINSMGLKDNYIEAHSDFLRYVLGLFTPETKNSFSIFKTNSFLNFCTKLNSLLIDGFQIYDTSRKEFWIWHQDKNPNIEIGEKLRGFLQII